MKRGELWTVAGGVYSSKPRPALILQDDLFDQTASVTVVPLTAHVLDSPLLRVRISATEVTGISRDSFLMIDKVTTVRRESMGERLGRVPAEVLSDVERAVMVFLGFAR